MTSVSYHVVMIWDGATASIYQNGSCTPESTNSYADDITGLNHPWYIGSYRGNDYCNGFIDDFIIYDRAISGAEVYQVLRTG